MGLHGRTLQGEPSLCRDLADRWVILSAKYGFIDPDFLIPGPYNVTFKRRATGPIDAETLRTQVRAAGLDQI